MIAVAFARTWHAMWWEWHVLTAVFAGIYLDRTLRRIDRHEAERLSAVVDAIRSGGPVDQILARFRQEGMSREEADVLERSARELSRVDALSTSTWPAVGDEPGAPAGAGTAGRGGA